MIVNADGTWTATSQNEEELAQVEAHNSAIRERTAKPQVADVPPPQRSAAELTQLANDARANGMQLFVDPKTGEATNRPIVGAPQNNAVTQQTMPGVSALQTDLAARQASSTPAGFNLTQTPGTPGTTVVDRLNAASTSGAVTNRAVTPVAMPAQRAGATATQPAPAPATAQFSPGLATQLSGATKPTGDYQSALSDPTKTGQAAAQAQSALGPAPTIDMGIADRNRGSVNGALDLSKQVVNAALAPQSQGAVDGAIDLSRQVAGQALAPQDQGNFNAAQGDQRALLDNILNGPNTADRIGSQVLRSQLALARSAAGGPGAVQEALRGAEMAAPELEAQAAQAATNETLQRQQAATQVTGQLGQGAAAQQQNENTRLGTAASAAGVTANTALGQQQNETQRIQAASNAASANAQGALGAQGQNIQIAQANQSAASALISNVSQLTGQQLELDQRNQELLGQMSRDLAAQNFNWAKLSADQQNSEWDRWVKTYQIDQTVAAQIKVASIAAKKGVMDYVIPIIGSLASLGAAAAK